MHVRKTFLQTDKKQAVNAPKAATKMMQPMQQSIVPQKVMTQQMSSNSKKLFIGIGIAVLLIIIILIIVMLMKKKSNSSVYFY